MIQFTDAYIRHRASISVKGGRIELLNVLILFVANIFLFRNIENY